jgi:putative phosphotransacetylase
MKIVINLSNHHIHLSQKDLNQLFGENYQLTKLHDLLQPDQFAAKETVTIRGTKGEIKKMRILGPIREKTQCEIMLGDVYHLGVKNPQIKLSGDLDNSCPFTIIGPVGTVEKRQGLIIAKRHIHLDEKTAKKWDVKNGEEVAVRAGLDERNVVFEDVIIRVSDKYVPECHIDFDEGNAAGVKNGDEGLILMIDNKKCEICFSLKGCQA